MRAACLCGTLICDVVAETKLSQIVRHIVVRSEARGLGCRKTQPRRGAFVRRRAQICDKVWPGSVGKPLSVLFLFGVQVVWQACFLRVTWQGRPLWTCPRSSDRTTDLLAKREVGRDRPGANPQLGPTGFFAHRQWRTRRATGHALPIEIMHELYR